MVIVGTVYIIFGHLVLSHHDKVLDAILSPYYLLSRHYVGKIEVLMVQGQRKEKGICGGSE